MIGKGLSQSVRKLSKQGNNVNILKGMTTSQKINVAGSLYAVSSGYKQSRNEGRGAAMSLTKGVTDAFLIDILGWKAYFGGAVLMGAPKAAIKGYESLSTQARQLSMAGSAAPFQSNTFVDNEQIYTMRQAGMGMIEQSQHNTKQAILGNEAQAMHR